MEKGQTFKAHKQIVLDKVNNIAQESWLVIKGSVKCILYHIEYSDETAPLIPTQSAPPNGCRFVVQY